ncbi:ferrochelatase [Lysobacter lacus]|uniref:Ferrochelatase n=2 Tax=Cognatilysobacter lacus TaxID=1643323 RepID=A0A5D8YEI7_9GAMM|nr:ferrochelatase [Lysobacter lacus]TZF80820.1 ferrochelatase [Lysobacter lacus]
MTDAAPRTALVLVNLGTPAAPTPRDVRRYLSEFLHDHRVVDLSRWLWCPLLHFVILPVRGKPVAKKYASIWMDGVDGGSPLAVYTRRLARAVQAQMPDVRVVEAMRYGKPALRSVLDSLRADGIERIAVLPLYPQYSTSTTGAVTDVVAAASPDARVVEQYHLDAGWVDAVAATVRSARAGFGGERHLLFSFHGLPERFIRRGDPYQQQCEASAAAIAASLGLGRAQWTIAYQSQFGREKWIGPSTQATLREFAARGVFDVDVVAPGFAVDCLETLEEVGEMLAHEFAQAGGRMNYVPCLNDSAEHARVLADIARRALA